jgi:transcriptional regulator with XRE-family HTH domain
VLRQRERGQVSDCQCALRLSDWRERVKGRLTQERLAERADLNIRTLQKIEAGELNILVTTLVRIQRALHCSWDKILPS